eukprot:1009911-Heterocapsa_arctica.AAC.1
MYAFWFTSMPIDHGAHSPASSLQCAHRPASSGELQCRDHKSSPSSPASAAELGAPRAATPAPVTSDSVRTWAMTSRHSRPVAGAGHWPSRSARPRW